MTTAKQTTDHGNIRKWAETRARAASQSEGVSKGGILRIDFREPGALGAEIP